MACPFLGLCAPGVAATQDGTEQPLIFECGPVFGPDATPESLATVFGDANVVSTDVHVGEGHYEPGMVVFGDTEGPMNTKTA